MVTIPNYYYSFYCLAKILNVLNNYASSINNYYLINRDGESYALDRKKKLKIRPDNLLLYIFFLQCIQSESNDLTEEESFNLKRQALIYAMIFPKENYFIYVLNECFKVKNRQPEDDGVIVSVEEPLPVAFEKKPESSSKASTSTTTKKSRSKSSKETGA